MVIINLLYKVIDLLALYQVVIVQQKRSMTLKKQYVVLVITDVKFVLI